MMSFRWGCLFVAGFALSAAVAGANARTFTKLHAFTGADGALADYSPVSSHNANGGALSVGKGGVLFGTTDTGGLTNRGTVFCLTPPTKAGAAWTHTTLHTFSSLEDGSAPSGSVAIDASGALYGFTAAGGNGDGVAYRLEPPAKAGDPWSESVIYTFGSGPSDGIEPRGTPLIIGKSVYGVTTNCTYFDSGDSVSCGTVFRLDPPSKADGAWTYTALYDLKAKNGSPHELPSGYLVVGKNGVIFGSGSVLEGQQPEDEIFKLTPPASGTGHWTKTIVRYFPAGPLTRSSLTGQIDIDTDGAIYGTTSDGGTGYGQIFKLTPPAKSGETWTATFSGAPFAAVRATASGGALIAKDGAIYTVGVFNNDDCATACGALIKIEPPRTVGGSWNGTVEHLFTGGADGGNPRQDLIQDSAGNIYGTTGTGGRAGDAKPVAYGWGIVFQLKP